MWQELAELERSDQVRSRRELRRQLRLEARGRLRQEFRRRWPVLAAFVAVDAVAWWLVIEGMFITGNDRWFDAGIYLNSAAVLGFLVAMWIPRLWNYRKAKSAS
jgi:hypothetical protein